MADEKKGRQDRPELLARPIDRRDFLRLAALGGATVGAGGLLAACSPASASPSAAASSASAAASSASSASSAPSVSAGAAAGRAIKIGFVSPQTGPLAGFGEADKFVFAGILAALKDGIQVGNALHPIEIVSKDSQSDPSRAAAVAGSLIADDKVDLMLVESTPETTNPVADTCEANGVPCLSTVAPWQPWFFARQADPAAPKEFDWTYHFFWGLEDIIAVFLDMWSQVPTNKKVGGLWPNDGDGNAWSDKTLGFPPPLTAAGYTITDPGRYGDGTPTNDFSAQIGAFKTAGVEILTGVPIPPDFTTFWTQAIQQGFKPKVASIGKALLFPSSVEALGDHGDGMSTEVWWSPSHPFKSSITGETAKSLADSYTTETTKQWTQPIGFVHALFEVATDALKRTKDIESKAAIRDAIAATNLATIVGPIAWTGKPFKNVAKTPLVGGQWGKGTSFKYDLTIVSNKDHPEIPAAGTMRPIPS
jgi:branched-chain amino acid transport system substrate-binding protein